ncbi:transcriptional regulator [Capnocytophaga sp. ARDL2]|uniref:helix-turn-helix transcriptional regulator n=1 Tax=Capnocytophaga sp. ARDL2 TaxID=3238809 RepID=UPI003555C1B3
MLPTNSKIKGIHPGVILKREIKSRGIKSKELAYEIDEHAQTLSAVLNGRRGVNPKLSIKLGQKLGVDDDYFMMLQAGFDVKNVAVQSRTIPNLGKYCFGILIFLR